MYETLMLVHNYIVFTLREQPYNMNILKRSLSISNGQRENVDSLMCDRLQSANDDR